MKSKITQSAPLILAASLLAGQVAVAATVYQWTDAEGIVHFSDVPPADSVSELAKMEYADYSSTGTETDEYSIVNQLETMTEWRRQITEERLARRELELEAKRIAGEAHINRYNVIERGMYYQPQRVYYQSYPVYPYYNSWHGQHRPHHNFGTPRPVQFKFQQPHVGAKY